MLSTTTLPTFAALTATLLGAAGAKAEQYIVKPDVGNSTMTAVFDAPFGERITAISSAVDCKLDVDKEKNTASGSCKIALTSIMVDGDATKTDHFYQWSTNKKTDPLKCLYELSFDELSSKIRLNPKRPFPISLMANLRFADEAAKTAKKRKSPAT